jgi:TetR/AcrR family transcriptional regulator
VYPGECPLTAKSISRNRRVAQLESPQRAKPASPSHQRTQPRQGKRLRRARGRPRDSGQTVGADTIVLEVCELLKELAPRDVTLLRVAQHAGIDRSLIRYYFKDRSSLLLAAARYLFAQLRNELATVERVPADDPEEQIRQSARALLRFQIEHPYFHRLMVDEVVNSEQPQAQAFFKSFTASGVSRHRAIADSIAQQPGMRKVDGAFLYIALIGMCEFFVTGAPILKVAFGRDYDVEAVNRAYEEFLADYMVCGLRKPSP